MTRGHHPYRDRSAYGDRSAALGEGFPDLIGGLVGLAVGLTRGTVVTARRLAEEAIWMDSPSSGPGRQGCGGCGGCGHSHYVVISDCGPCTPCSHWSCCS